MNAVSVTSSLCWEDHVFVLGYTENTVPKEISETTVPMGSLCGDVKQAVGTKAELIGEQYCNVILFCFSFCLLFSL